MKLKSAAFYQYVKFQGKNENFLVARDSMPDLELELVPVGNTAIISVKTAKDHILVFPTNVAYCVPMTEETKSRKEFRGRIADNDPAAPRK